MLHHAAAQQAGHEPHVATRAGAAAAAPLSTRGDTTPGYGDMNAGEGSQKTENNPTPTPAKYADMSINSEYLIYDRKCLIR